MELNREQIIKSWEDEIAVGKEVGLKRDFINYVSISLVNDTLSLIKELIEENEAWQKQSITEEEKASKAYYDLACEIENLRAENERLQKRNAALIEINYIVLKECMPMIKVDTIKKMLESITKHATNGYPRKVRLDVIERIVKDMLGEKND